MEGMTFKSIHDNWLDEKDLKRITLIENEFKAT